MEMQLQQWGAKLDALAAKADIASADAKADYHKRIDELKVKRDVAKVKLDELKASTSDNWDTLKGGAESAWKDLETAFKRMKF